MSHQDVAAIWSTLQGRSDIDNILQECIGHYSLKASRFCGNRKQLRANAFTHFVSIRTIFDLQRTYLQSLDLSQDSKASLIQADLLVSTIFHLLEVQSLTFVAEDALQDHEAYLSFAGKTLLSGLRAAHLRGIQLSVEQHEMLTSRFGQVWNRESLRERDHFIINFLCRRAISEIGTSTASSIYSKPACGVVSLPDFYHGLYPVEDQKNAVVEAVRNALASSSNSADWLDCSLFLYDTFWSMQAALIQLCMDVQNDKTSQWSFSEQAILLNNLNSILTPRLKMLDRVYQDPPYKTIPGTFDWTLEQTKVMISQELHPMCTSHSCSCFGNERANIQDLWLRSGGHHILSNMNEYMAPTQHLDIGNILKDFRLQVDTRNATLPDFSKELKHLSRKIASDAHRFSSDSTSRTTDLNNRGQSADEIFILDCPELHAISGQYMTERLPSNSMAKARKDALGSGDPSLLKDVQSGITCSQCSWQSQEFSARKIEPLSQITTYIQERLDLQQRMDKVRADLLANSLKNLPSSPSSPGLAVQRSPRPSPSRSRRMRTGPSEDHATNAARSPTYPRSPNDSPRPRTLHPDIAASNSQSPSRDNFNHIAKQSPNLRSASSFATASGSETSSAVFSGSISQYSSRAFSPPPMPPKEYSTLPEVVEDLELRPSKTTSIRSRRASINSSNPSKPSRKQQEKKSHWPFSRTNKPLMTSSKAPTATFFASGRTLMLWNDIGAGEYNLEELPSVSFRSIAMGEIELAAGGTRRCAVVAKMGPTIMLRSFQNSSEAPIHEMEIEEIPLRLAVSVNDHYVALKFGTYLRILNLQNGTTYHHQLPAQNGRCSPLDHLISFSTDCLSVIASTRFEPEKVVTYFCPCQSPGDGRSIASSAPSGLVNDSGLSSIVYSNQTAFLTTWTESGPPVYLTLGSRPQYRPLRDKNHQIGSRIHRAALCATGQNLVMLNDRNELFWIMNPFGRESAPTWVGNVKRVKSMKREVEISLPTSDEVHIFWIEKGKGILVTMGRFGGKSKPIEIGIDMDELLEPGEGI